MTPYARLEITLITLLGAVATAVVAWWAGPAALLPALLSAALLAFYRDPHRTPPRDPAAVLAAADGTIVSVRRAVPTADGRRELRIMTFLSVFNVHVNRSPCAGRVLATAYKPGAFLNALNPAADDRNESHTLVLEPAAPLPGPVTVRQIAGVLARRIVCAARPRDQLTAGQRFGMIKLGSRTEVCLPEDTGWEVLVAPGDKVRAGLTVLARRRADAPAPVAVPRSDAR